MDTMARCIDEINDRKGTLHMTITLYLLPPDVTVARKDL